MNKRFGAVLALVLVSVLLFGACGRPVSQPPESKSGKVPVGWLVADRLTVQEGGSNFYSTVDLNAELLTLDADLDSTIQAASDDIVLLALGDATGYLSIRLGNLRVGNGTPGSAQDGEDFYCEGKSEFDGAARFDGTTALNDDVTVAEAIVYTAGTVTPVQGGVTLVADLTFYYVISGGAYSMTLGTSGAVDGQMLILYGRDANNVTINDINLLSSSGGALTLGQYDIATFIYIGGSVNTWAEISLIADS